MIKMWYITASLILLVVVIILSLMLAISLNPIKKWKYYLTTQNSANLTVSEKNEIHSFETDSMFMTAFTDKPFHLSEKEIDLGSIDSKTIPLSVFVERKQPTALLVIHRSTKRKYLIIRLISLVSRNDKTFVSFTIRSKESDGVKDSLELITGEQAQVELFIDDSVDDLFKKRRECKLTCDNKAITTGEIGYAQCISECYEDDIPKN
jgi:hypothetical protein